MKQVKLSHFLRELEKRGINIVGCVLTDNTSTYEFLGMEQQNAKVKYGQNRERTGHMSAWLKVDSLSWKPPAGNRIRSINGDSGSIVINFSDMERGYW